MVSSHSNATITLHGLDRALDLCDILIYFPFISVWFEQTENTSLGGASVHWGAERFEAERRRRLVSFQEIPLILHIGVGFPCTLRRCQAIESWTVIKIRCLAFFFFLLYLYMYIYFFFSRFFLFIYFFIFTSNPESDCLSAPAVESLGEVAQAAVGHRSFPVSVAVWHQQRDSGVKSCLFKNPHVTQTGKMLRRPVRAQWSRTLATFPWWLEDAFSLSSRSGKKKTTSSFPSLIFFFIPTSPLFCASRFKVEINCGTNTNWVVHQRQR